MGNTEKETDLQQHSEKSAERSSTFCVYMMFLHDSNVLVTSRQIFSVVHNITSCTQSRLMTDGSSAVSGRDRQMPWMTRETSRRLNK